MNRWTPVIAALVLSCAPLASAASPVHADLLGPATRPAGPLANVREIVFAVRETLGEHWYANFGYYCPDENRKAYRAGGKLCKLELATGKLTTMIDDPQGGIRDPQVSYDGTRILFSWRKAGTENYNLYEINTDGAGIRRLTDAPYDDIEPTYLPDGGIMFVSSRCNRWVNCWLTQVAVLHRCDADGRNIRIISTNIEQDNTPWPMPDGRILYTRWEYVDRSQLGFHHLWTFNPDGTDVEVFYGNMHHGTVMIDAKPIPNSRKIVASFSPGHGKTEHAGTITVVDPNAGPDNPASVQAISKSADCHDPFPLSENLFLVAEGTRIELMDGDGATQVLYTSDGTPVHEPRPIVARPREPVIPQRVDLARDTGKLILSDVTYGRNMDGIAPGEVKKLLVLETLPKPVNFTGGMDPLSYGGTFTLERIVGTIPVEADGSAYAEIPACRSVFLVALDKDDLAIKRMQSFLSVQPGETLGCVGCHEQRTSAPPPKVRLMAMQRQPSKVEPVADVPDVLDFPRDIQPILNARCVSCHDWPNPKHGIVFSGDRGPLFSHSYYTLFARKLVSDGRNGQGNRPPRSIGSSASPLLKQLSSHHATPLEIAKVRLWIDTGCAYPGTYASLNSGELGGYVQNSLDRTGSDAPQVVAAVDAMHRRCAECHKSHKVVVPVSPWDDQGHQPWTGLRDQVSRHYAYNLTRPAFSLVLLAPLSEKSGGLGICRAGTHGKQPAADPFATTDDPDYRVILAGITEAKRQLEEKKRFDMPGFRPNAAYVREMKRFGVLPATFDLATSPIDVYATDQAYWRSLWWQPKTTTADGR